MQKDIIILRFGNPFPIILPNGDKYDSIIQMDGKTIYNVNTDFSVSYINKGGILAEGIYAGLVTDFNFEKLGKHIALFDANHFLEVEIHSDINPEWFVLPSLIPNPTHNDKKIIEYVCIHGGGLQSDYSAGCITIHPDYYKNFINEYMIGDKMFVTLKRSQLQLQPVPDFYQGN